MLPRLIQPTEDSNINGRVGGGGGFVGEPCLVLTSDPKPRLRWTADLHERFVDAVTQLGGPSKATPKAIMRTMGVKGLTLFHLKSHLQKYRLGKLSGKDFGETSKDGLSASYLIESPRATSSQSLPASDGKESFEVKESLRAQMEVQSKLHLQVKAEKHLQFRQDAEKRYLSMLEKACMILADQIVGVMNMGSENHQESRTDGQLNSSQDQLDLGHLDFTNATGISVPEELSPRVHPHCADGSTESCLTSHDSPAKLHLEGSPSGGKKCMLTVDSTTASLIWGESDLKTRDLPVLQVNSNGIPGCGA